MQTILFVAGLAIVSLRFPPFKRLNFSTLTTFDSWLHSTETVFTLLRLKSIAFLTVTNEPPAAGQS